MSIESDCFTVITMTRLYANRIFIMVKIITAIRSCQLITKAK